VRAPLEDSGRKNVLRNALFDDADAVLAQKSRESTAQPNSECSSVGGPLAPKKILTMSISRALVRRHGEPRQEKQHASHRD